MATLQENITESTVDRFSNLPNEIAHHILSSLTFKDATRVACVSKRCRGLHLSSPSVNFCDFSDVNNLSSCEVRTSLLDSFGRYLIQRGDQKIQCFRFSWCAHFQDIFDNEDVCYCDEGHLQLSSWIDIAVRCDVEVVQLTYLSPYWLEFLPSSLFICESLKSLMVDVKRFIGELAPSLSNLEYLKLSNVIVEKEFWKWFSESCKCIKELHLDRVSGAEDIIIDSTSLESFRFDESLFGGDCRNINISGDRLEKLVIKWGGQPKTSVKISAPKLKYLEWFGNFASEQQFGEQVAHLSSFFEVNHLALFDILCIIRRVKVLIMSDSILKAFLKEGFMSPRLDGVGCLSLQNLVLTDDLVPAMIMLLGAVPNLDWLFIKSMSTLDCDESNCSGFDMEFWKLQNLDFIKTLKEFTIDVYRGSNVLEFAKFVLIHAHKLEKMLIFHLPSQREDVMEEIQNKNSNVTIRFRQFDLFNPSSWTSW